MRSDRPAPKPDIGHFRKAIIAAANAVHAINAALCAVLLAAVFLAQATVVVLRYAFSAGFVELQDAVSFAFAGLVVLALPLALRADRHVRIEIFRERQSIGARRRTDIAAIAIFLVPVFTAILFLSLPGAATSWSIGESSREAGGLPFYYLVKAALPVSCLLMLVQGLAVLAAPAPCRRDEASRR